MTRGYRPIRSETQEGSIRKALNSRDLWILAALVAGAGLRLWQYLGDASLWVDELALARNLLERSASGLIGRPLDFAQVAPPGFLLAVKGAVTLLGHGELALRLVPLLGALASLPLFLALARRVLPASSVPVAMLLFALAPPLFQRAGELHQYSTDVATAIAIALMALRWLERPDRGRGLSLGAVVAVVVWFSQSAVFVGVGVLSALLVWGLTSGRSRTAAALLPGLLVAGASMIGAFFTAETTLTPPVRSLMYDYWIHWMIPWDSRQAIRWLLAMLPDPFRKEFALGGVAAIGYTLLAGVGWVRLLWRQYGAALVVVTPVLVVLLAAAGHQYPFGSRQVLFLLPSALLGIAAGIDVLAEAAARQWGLAGYLVQGILLLPTVWVAIARHPVIRQEDVRPAWRHIAATRSPGEPVYVYYTGWLAAGYYAHRAGIPDADLRFGRCHTGDLEGYRAELRAIATGRLWLFFTHSLKPDRLGIVGYLDSTAVRIDSLVILSHPLAREPGASVYRFDVGGMPRIPDGVPAPSAASAPVCRTPGPHLPVDSVLGSWGGR